MAKRPLANDRVKAVVGSGLDEGLRTATADAFADLLESGDIESFKIRFREALLAFDAGRTASSAIMKESIDDTPPPPPEE